jgi:hypothetical protein
MFEKIILKLVFLFLITMSINISILSDNTSNAFELLMEYNNSLDFLQLYENCFNGIDDDGDNLIDRQDVFDC